MPRARTTKTDKYISDEKIAGYTECSYAEALWLTTRYTNHVLPPAVTAVLVFIIHRTMRYHKDTDAISLSQFSKGIMSKDTETLLTSACGYSKTTVVRALIMLEEMELIQRTKVRDSVRGNAPTSIKILHKNVFQLAKYTVHQTDKDRNMARLNLSKRFKQINNLDTPPCTIPTHALYYCDPRPCSKLGHTQSGNTQSEVTQSEKPSAPSSQTARGDLKSIAITAKDVISTALEKSRTSRTSAVASAKATGALTIKAANEIWRKAMAQHFEGSPYTTLTLKTFAILKKAYSAHHVSDIEEFMNWSVENWTYNRKHSLQWYTSGGARLALMPDIDQFARLYKHFVKLFADSKIGEHHKVDESAAARIRLEAAEAKNAELEDRLARSRKEADRALQMKDRQMDALRKDTARVLSSRRISPSAARPLKTEQELASEMAADKYSEALPEWANG